MTFDTTYLVRVAYKKLKQMVYYDKHPLSLRRRLAEFECESDFEERLNKVAEVIDSQAPNETPQFKRWNDEISFDLIPKSVVAPLKPQEGQGSFVSNVTSANVHKVEKVN